MNVRPPGFDGDGPDAADTRDAAPDPLAVADEREALTVMRPLLAKRLRSAPAYLVDRLNRELRQVNRRIAELDAEARPVPADETSERSMHDVALMRRRAVLAAVAAGADPVKAVDALADALPLPSGTPLHEDLADRHQLTNAARAATAALAA